MSYSISGKGYLYSMILSKKAFQPSETVKSITVKNLH